MIDTRSRHKGNTHRIVPTSLPSPFWVAHRGGSAISPENTLSAFREGLAGPARFIEGDFRLTADGQIIACHDATTLKMTGVELWVDQTPLATLQQLPILPVHGRYASIETIPTLEQVLELLPPEKGLFLEIKSGPELVPPLVQVLDRFALPYWQVVVIAYDPAVVRAVRQQLPELKVHWLFEWHEDLIAPSPTMDELIDAAIDLDAHGLGLNYCDQLTPSGAANARAAGLELHVYTVDELHGAQRCIELGVNSITSNQPTKLATQIQYSCQQGPDDTPDAASDNSYAEDALIGKDQ